ncbi:MAG: ComEA family DNA-binding protein [Candidatus Levybacteria bacterium]|nr:ComEA family DNA-binding protein [Candidatus Levybacteria bacterium]
MQDSEKSLQDRLIEFGKKNFLILGLFSVGLILIGIGLIQIFGSRETQIKFEKGEDVAGVESSKIKVDVEGEVIKPGVYELSGDARVQDALIAAGGLTSDANRKSINLAAKIADGQKIYVPAVGEVISASNSNTNQGTTLNLGSVSINSATEAQLDTLPGIGPVTAGKIINGRPYGQVEELLERKIVGKATFEKISDLITL